MFQILFYKNIYILLTNANIIQIGIFGGEKRKMKNKLIIKGLVFGIIVLFIGTSVVAASINSNQNNAKDKDYTAHTASAPIYNLIGGVNITFGTPFRPHAVNFTWWKVTDRNFTFPITGNFINDVNYTFRIKANSTGFFILPRLVQVQTLCVYPSGSGSESGLIFFWTRSPGFVKDITVRCANPGIIPPLWPKHTLPFETISNAIAITFFPIVGDGESSPNIIHKSPASIPFVYSITFWAVLP